MPNPSGYPESLSPPKRADEITAELAKQAIGVKLPVEVDAAIRALPNKTAWLRRVLIEAAKREGLV